MGTDTVLLQYLLKSALIELCGWIEKSQDLLLKNCGDQLKLNAAAKDVLADKIKNNYGFSYNKHFRELLCFLIGIHAVVLIEKELGQTVFETFKADLGNLKSKRDEHAHGYIDGNPVFFGIDRCVMYYSSVRTVLVAFEVQLSELAARSARQRDRYSDTSYSLLLDPPNFARHL